MDKIEEILGKIGLTKQESRAYLGLLELEESQTGRLCKHIGIASSNIYRILESLIEKGLASYKLENNIKIFMPAPPESLNELFLEKKRILEEERKEVNQLINNLKNREIKKERYSDYKYYEGITGIKSMWHEINYSINKEFAIKIYSGKKGSYERLVGFFNEHHNLRKEKKVKERLIFPKEEIKIAKKRKDNLTEIRFMNLKNEGEWGVWKNIFYIHYYPVEKKPRAFLIKDKIFAKMFEQVFDQLWEKAEKRL